MVNPSNLVGVCAECAHRQAPRGWSTIAPLGDPTSTFVSADIEARQGYKGSPAPTAYRRRRRISPRGGGRARGRPPSPAAPRRLATSHRPGYVGRCARAPSTSVWGAAGPAVEVSRAQTREESARPTADSPVRLTEHPPGIQSPGGCSPCLHGRSARALVTVRRGWGMLPVSAVTSLGSAPLERVQRREAGAGCRRRQVSLEHPLGSYPPGGCFYAHSHRT